MTVVAISRKTARAFMGSSWYGDVDAGVIRENLGKGTPPFHFAEVYATAEEAAQKFPDLKFTRSLPEKVSLPKGTPIALPSGRTLHNASTRLYLVRFGNLLEKGIRIENLPIAAVTYIPAPHSISRWVDFVASTVSVDISENTTLRVRIGHGPDLRPFVAEAPAKSENWGWSSCNDMLAFLSATDAQDYADKLADRLRAAADWRANSPDFPAEAFSAAA